MPPDEDFFVEYTADGDGSAGAAELAVVSERAAAEATTAAATGTVNSGEWSCSELLSNADPPAGSSMSIS